MSLLNKILLVIILISFAFLEYSNREYRNQVQVNVSDEIQITDYRVNATSALNNKDNYPFWEKH